jgi:G8 domain
MARIKIKKAIPLVLLVSLLHLCDAAKQLRGDLNQTAERQLQGSDIRDFKPLSCNGALSRNPCTTTWSSQFGTSISHTKRIVIPCGQCILMDHASGDLNLRDGIDIIGKLVFPNDYRLAVTTTTVIVQGELQMTATKQVDGVPNIKFTLVGTNNDLTFTPFDVNANACSGISTCMAGKKSIVVAGGKVARE